MVARRLTIVSLLTILFGIGFAHLVAEAGRERHWRPGKIVPCSVDQGIRCTDLN